jgi:adenine deaminase
MAQQITANLVDVVARQITPAQVSIEAGKIAAIASANAGEGFLLPGFIDAHVHIESSMMVPAEFARLAVVHGTVATVSDPHEIANVLGIDGVRFMIADGKRTHFKFHWGVPSCVPATAFETAGAALTPAEVRELFVKDGCGYLSEMMNYPGVLHGDAGVMAKIAIAKELGKPIDGHAPGLRGVDARRYAAAGITTDHECIALDEALDKIACGMKILIREGSAAKNFAALEPLLKTHPRSCMLCTDDMHPDALAAGHINRLVARAVRGGADLFDVLFAACVHPVQHYGLPVGQLRVGDPADFILVDDLKEFSVRKTWIDGEVVAEKGRSTLPASSAPAMNRFGAKPISPSALSYPLPRREGLGEGLSVRVIGAREGALVTEEQIHPAKVKDGHVVADPERDILTLVVVNRYQAAPPAVALIQGFGLQRGAIAASVAHDSHNILAVGTDDAALAQVVNALIESRGGLAATDGVRLDVLPLDVAGLMGRDGAAITAGYERLDAAAKCLGSTLAAPFMTLSFMALLVIPSLKLSDKGLFDGRKFEFVDLFV